MKVCYTVPVAIRTLTPKQKETLDFIRSYISRRGMSPLVTDIQEEFNLSSLRSVTQRLDALERKGLIQRNRFQHRGVSIPNENPFSTQGGFVQVPVLASVGCDQQTIFAQEQFGEYLTVDKAMLDYHRDVVAFKATGGSMIDAGIHNGDYVLVEKTPYAENGDRVVAIVGDMAVLKRFQRAGTNIILQPEAKGYQPIVVNENFKIFGKFIKTIPMNFRSQDDTQVIYD